MKTLLQVAVSAAFLGAMQGAFAVSLVPDVVTPLPGTTVAAEPQLAGVVLADETTPYSFFDGVGINSGTVQSRVVRSDVDGTLDFYWRVVSSAGQGGDIGAFRIANFMTSAYNANWRSDGLGNVAPSAARLFGGAGGDVNFLFGGGTAGSTFSPGAESFFMFLDTNATNYAKTATYDLTGTGAGNISLSYATFAPAVPEPATYAMFGVGLLAIAALRRRRS